MIDRTSVIATAAAKVIAKSTPASATRILSHDHLISLVICDPMIVL